MRLPSGWSCVLPLLVLLVGGVHARESRNERTTLQTCEKRILFLPLDERFTTRDIVVNLAKTTPYCLVTPDASMLPAHKTAANLTAIDSFISENIANADAMIVSAEMYLYGGLINSRVSNDSLATIDKRLERLVSYSKQYPKLQILLSNVVMRIPSYNGDAEVDKLYET